jgi:hypothetical protein
VVGAVLGESVEGVGDRGDAGAEGEGIRLRTTMVALPSGRSWWLAATSARCRNGLTRDRMLYVSAGCFLISARSAAVRGPGLSRMRLETPSLPMS